MSQPAFDFGDDGALDDAASPTFTVCELADAVNHALRRSFTDGVWVRGEIQDLSERNGHAYLTLADDTPGQKAVVRVQFFAKARARLRPLLVKHRLRLAVGMKVRVFGHLDFYGPSGTLGLKMTDLDPRYTLGDLAQQRDQVLRRLAADGALDANRRHRLSPVPLRVGVVSSTGSAAWHDFRHEIEHSGFGFHLVLADTRVQGPEAPRLVTRAIEALSRHARTAGLDAIVVIRGGGARNELAVFDTEAIARAITTAPVPVLTGLGHEIDRSVADEVAHTSWKTPTACAGALVDAVRDYQQQTEHRFDVIRATAQARLVLAAQGVTDRTHRVARRTHAAVGHADERLAVRVHRLASGALRPLDRELERLDRVAGRVAGRAPQLLSAESRHVAAIEARVRVLDPVNVLARGWSITRAADGRVVRSPSDVRTGEAIRTQLATGHLDSRVTASDDPSDERTTHHEPPSRPGP